MTSCVVFKSKIFKIWLISDSDIFKITSRLHLEQIEFTVLLLQAHHILIKSKKERSVVVLNLDHVVVLNWTTSNVHLSEIIGPSKFKLDHEKYTDRHIRYVTYQATDMPKPRTTSSSQKNHPAPF